MAQKKVHFKSDNGSVCGRGEGRYLTDNVHRVTCRACGSRPEFVDAMAVAQAIKMEQFLKQEPCYKKEPWTDGLMVCSNCGNETFREADRTCYGHYSNHVCAECGHTESRLTETGMSF